MPVMLELQTLGNLRIRVDGQPSSLRSKKAKALLVYLAMERSEQPRASLAALLWPESDQRHADTSLRVALTALNKACEPFLVVSREHVALDWSKDIRLDAHALLQSADQNLDGQITDLYQGPFLAGFHIADSEPFETWRSWQQERLLRSITEWFHRAIRHALQDDSGGDPISLALQLLKLDSLDETAHRAIMITHARRGNRAAAMEQYGRCADALKTELGAEPSEQTRLLLERIQGGEAEALEYSVAAMPVVLPTGSPLVGRQKELADLLARIQSKECRLVTVLGPGGIGKSRLAIEALRAGAGGFQDGAFFCPLGQVPSGEMILPAMAQTLDFSFDSLMTMLDPKSQFLDFLSNRRILLVLDGFEHLIASADFVVDMLASTPSLMLVVTSRERLNLSEEWVLPIDGLSVQPVNGAGSPAMDLFKQRVAQARGDRPFENAEHNAAEMICTLVEGNPLAIELAAAWSGTLTVQEILTEMQASMDFLTSRMRDVPGQHRSLRAVFEHSWNLLPPRLRDAFCAFSVFRGAFGRDAAEEVARAGWVELSALGDKSLVRRNALGRYQLHALLNEYAREKLEQDPAAAERVRNRHARHYLGHLHRVAPDLISTGMPAARESVDQELTNIWLALEWAIQHFEREEVRTAIDDLFSFYVVFGWHEGALALERLANIILGSRPDLDPEQPYTDPLYRSTAARQAWFLAHLGQTKECISLSNLCLGWTGEDPSPEDRSICFNNLGISAGLEGDFEQGIECLERAIELGQGYAESVYPSYHLWLGYLRFFQGLYPESMADYEVCYELFERQGNQPGMAFALSKMGLSADGMGSYEQGLAYHRRALDTFRSTDHRSGQAYTYSRMSVDAYGMGDYPQAAGWAQDGLIRFRALGHRWGICISQCRLGFAEVGCGQFEPAREHFLSALTQAHEHKLAPLALYSILGLACILQREGKEVQAVELHHAVAANRQTPRIYLDLAARWFEPGHLVAEKTSDPVGPSLEITGKKVDYTDLYELAGQLLEETRCQLIAS
jgi:predicted ATPase/DNA-binding SARP family transcriptional activator